MSAPACAQSQRKNARFSPTLAVIVTVGWFHVTPAPAQTIAPDDTPLQNAAQEPDQKPPATVGEEGTKPTRGGFSALGHNLIDDVKHIPRRNTAYWLAGGGALALAIHPEDGKINRRLLGSSAVDKLFIPGKWIGNDAVFAAGSLGTYLVGRSMQMPRVEHLGMDEIEALLLAEGMAETEKLVFRRHRPIEPTGHQSRGYSFPSGHATLAFAAATVLQRHLGYQAGVPAYLIASYVAMSRLHDNRHYASDVIFGAATGIVVGRSVTWHGRNFWGGPIVIPVPGGVALVFSAAHA